MNKSLSLIFGEIINASDIEYKDCKDFQLVCPNCKEPVFKSERMVESRDELVEFFSHYKKSIISDDCELRVGSMSESDFETLSSKTRGQSLLKFKKVLKQHFDESIKNQIGEKEFKEVKKITIKRKSNKYFKQLLDMSHNSLREFIKDPRIAPVYTELSKEDTIRKIINNIHANKPELFKEKLIDIYYDLLMYILKTSAGEETFRYLGSWCFSLNSKNENAGILALYKSHLKMFKVESKLDDPTSSISIFYNILRSYAKSDFKMAQQNLMKYFIPNKRSPEAEMVLSQTFIVAVSTMLMQIDIEKIWESFNLLKKVS